MKIRWVSVLSPCARVVSGDPEATLGVCDCVDVALLAAVHAMASTRTTASTRRRGERIGRGVYRRPRALEGGVGLLLFPWPRIQDQRPVRLLVEVERILE